MSDSKKTDKKAASMRPEKIAEANEIETTVKGSDYCFVLNYAGLKVSQFTALRAELRKAKSSMHVVKNSYLARAASAKGWKLDELLNGPTAMITGSGDPAEVAKIVESFLEKNEKAAVKGAQLADQTLKPEQVKELSKLPSKDTLRAQLLALLMQPATSLVRVFTAPLTGVLYVLKAKADKGDQPKESPAAQAGK